ncbi:MAG TPA: NAD(P)-dependent oxidoreductase, partial [Pseudolysinimonas sp.]|nr:NAD(P)-dependent oxidoreductase [Pseudolysinimonas sp.]
HHDPLPEYFPIDERIPTAVDDWYSLSKLADEQTLGMACSHWGMSGVAIRLPWLADPDDVRRESDSQTADPGRSMRVGWGWIDTRDAAEAIIGALLAPYEGCHVVCICADETLVPYRTEDLLDRFAPTVPRRSPIPGRSTPIDTSAARQLFGFDPRYGCALESRTL